MPVRSWIEYKGFDVAGIEIVEVAPRDGLQNEATPVGTAAKVALIAQAVQAGARRIEATSFVDPQRVPQMADAEEVMAAVPRGEASYIGLVLNERGLQRAVAAGVDEINAVVVASEEFSRRNQGVGTEESMRAWSRIADVARSAGIRRSGTVAAAFGCPFTGEVPTARAVELAARAAEASPDEIALADTIGVAVPTQVTERLTAVREVTGEVPLRLHLHNTRNTGYENAVAAVTAGASALDASLGGIGGCPFAPAATGNIATEDLAWMCERMGIVTGLDVARLVEAAEWLGGELGHPVPALQGRAGPFPPG